MNQKHEILFKHKMNAGKFEQPLSLYQRPITFFTAQWLSINIFKGIFFLFEQMIFEKIKDTFQFDWMCSHRLI